MTDASFLLVVLLPLLVLHVHAAKLTIQMIRSQPSVLTAGCSKRDCQIVCGVSLSLVKTYTHQAPMCAELPTRSSCIPHPSNRVDAALLTSSLPSQMMNGAKSATRAVSMLGRSISARVARTRQEVYTINMTNASRLGTAIRFSDCGTRTRAR